MLEESIQKAIRETKEADARGITFGLYSEQVLDEFLNDVCQRLLESGEYLSKKELVEKIELRKKENEHNYDPDPENIFPILQAEKYSAIQEDAWFLWVLSQISQAKSQGVKQE